MKKLLLLISFLCSCQIGATQTLKRIGVLERKNNTLFIAEGSHRFLVKQEVVTVKLKKGPISMSTNKNKIRSNRLGFVDLAVPIGIDIESYVSSLEKSRNFEVVEYNSIGEYCLTTNDTEVNRQWYLSSINLFNAWDFTMEIQIRRLQYLILEQIGDILILVTVPTDIKTLMRHWVGTILREIVM